MSLKMKRSIFNIPVLVFLGIAMGSACSFLEVEQIGKSDIEGFFSEESSAKAALYGTMSLAADVYDKYMLPYSEIAADELVLNTSEATWKMYQDFSVTSSDEVGAMGYIWKNGYQVINNCNQVIEHVPGLVAEFPNSRGSLEGYMAQAYFIRAFMHLNLCLSYGQNYTFTPDASHLGVPVIDHTLSLSDKPSRNTVAEVYRAVTADLEKALDLFPADFVADKYFPSPLACKALLARTYLYMENWEKASGYANEVIGAKELVGRDGYYNMFWFDPESAYDESIFRINGYRQSGEMYRLFWRNEPKARPSEKVTALLEDTGDIRRTLLYDSDYGCVCMKHNCPVNENKDLMYKNHIILRVSEMYLIRAEAALALGDSGTAVDDIEALRSRAFGRAVALSDAEKSDMAKTIADERVRELCFEGHRLWDISRRHESIVRTSDNSSSVLELTYPDYRFVLPISSVELEANGNMQPNPDTN